jgi:hypothetical protein
MKIATDNGFIGKSAKNPNDWINKYIITQ